jgi:predicted ATP-grasp superfamily ATP-dependent carboligase
MTSANSAKTLMPAAKGDLADREERSARDVPAAATPGVIVLGGAHGALAVIRSLGRQAVPVCYITNDHPIPGLSRYATMSARWPGPAHPDALGFLTGFADQKKLAGWLLIPAGDAEVRFVATHHRELSGRFALLTQDWSSLEPLHDKRRLYALARQLGVPCPAEVAPSDPAHIRYPVVLKPASRDAASAGTASDLWKAWSASDAAEFAPLYAEAVRQAGAGSVIVQEMIPGGGDVQFSYAAIWREGRPLAWLTARRLRQFPVDFGFTSTYVETAPCPRAVAAAERILSATGYHGLVEVEFKLDRRDGLLKILDVNTRPWTWIGLGEAAGIDFPFFAYCVAFHRPMPAVVLHGDAAWIHVARDMLSAAANLRRGRLSLASYAGGFLRRMSFAAFASDDPVPVILSIPIIARRVLRRFRLRFGRGAGNASRNH